MHNVIRDLINSVFPQDKYLTYGSGNCPIVISVPHGGNIQPINIPKRTWGNRSRDTYTRRLAELIISKLKINPYYIISDIHRNRVDLNREIHEAAQGNKKAEEIWTDWNAIINGYINNIYSKSFKILYIDIHSHNNSNEFQIGYGLSVNDYLDVKAGWDIKGNSTMYAFKEKTNEFPALFGEYSFPQSIESYGYKVLLPKDEKHYLNGGRNIKHFSNNSVGAIQIECPIPVLKKELNSIADCLVYGINRFKEKFLD